MPGGVSPFTPKQGLEALRRLLAQDSPQVGVVPFDWQQLFRSYPAARRLTLLIDMLRETSFSKEEPGEKGKLTPDALREANAKDRKTLLESYFRDQLAKILSLPAAKVDANQPILEMGVDSLTALELQNQVRTDLGIYIPILSFLQNQSLAQLAAKLLMEFPASGSTAAPGQQNAAEPVPGVEPSRQYPGNNEQLQARIDDLSDEEVDELLVDILAAKKESK